MIFLEYLKFRPKKAHTKRAFQKYQSIRTNQSGREITIILPVSIKLGCEINDSLFQKKVYVNALCELREEERIFRLDRIKILSLLKRDNI